MQWVFVILCTFVILTAVATLVTFCSCSRGQICMSRGHNYDDANSAPALQEEAENSWRAGKEGLLLSVTDQFPSDPPGQKIITADRLCCQPASVLVCNASDSSNRESWNILTRHCWREMTRQKHQIIKEALKKIIYTTIWRFLTALQ